MPQEAEDLAEDMIFRFLDEQDWLVELQRRVIDDAERIQNLPKAQLSKYGPTAVRNRMLQLNRDTLGYFRNRFDDIYLAGARTVDPTFQIGAAERKRLALQNTNEYLRLRRAQEGVVRDSKRFLEMVWNDRKDRRKKLGIKYTKVDFRNRRARDAKVFLGRSESGRKIFTERTVPVDNSERTIRLRGIKAVQYSPRYVKTERGFRQDKKPRKYTLSDYSNMVVRTNANRAYNMGVLDAIAKKGIEWVAVSDGPECGWTFHDDPEAANGMVVTLDEARANPLAHPNCRRAFAPATPQQIKDEERRRGKEAKSKKAKAAKEKSTAQKVALGLAAGLGGGLAAAEITNLAVAGAERFVGSAAFNGLLERLATQAFHGSTTSRWFVQRLSSVQSVFTGDSTLASVTQIYPGGPTNLPTLPLFDNVRYFADGFAEGTGIKNIPGYVKQAIGAADDAVEAQLSDRFQAFYQAAKRAAMSEDTGDNIRNVIDMEARRRGMFFRRLDDLPGAPEVRAAWTRWGPRARVDVTDWLRAKTTFTPTGAINTLAVNAAGQVRGVFKIYQDGLMGGHISAIPKNFLNGVVRAIVEIDERGHLVGNLRLVPGGPLRLRLEFKTDTVTQDLRDFSISPLGALGNIAEQFRKFSFDRAVLELRVFNQSIFDISANLRIPVSALRTAVRDAVAKKDLQAVLTSGYPIERYTGTLNYIIRNPNFVKKIYEDSKATLFGNIRFTSLTRQAREASPVLRALGDLNVRLLNRAHLADGRLQDIAINMKIHGWNIYDIANVLQMRMEDAKILVKNGTARLRGVMEDWGVVRPEDLLPVWEDRMVRVRQQLSTAKQFRDRRIYPRTNEAVDVALSTVYSIGDGIRLNPYQYRVLQEFIGAQPGDTTERLYLRLRTTIAFIRAQGDIEEGLPRGSVDGITEHMMFNAAQELYRRQQSALRLVR